jgi:hypothetical protein
MLDIAKLKTGSLIHAFDYKQRILLILSNIVIINIHEKFIICDVFDFEYAEIVYIRSTYLDMWDHIE